MLPAVVAPAAAALVRSPVIRRNAGMVVDVVAKKVGTKFRSLSDIADWMNKNPLKAGAAITAAMSIPSIAEDIQSDDGLWSKIKSVFASEDVEKLSSIVDDNVSAARKALRDVVEKDADSPDIDAGALDRIDTYTGVGTRVARRFRLTSGADLVAFREDIAALLEIPARSLALVADRAVREVR